MIKSCHTGEKSPSLHISTIGFLLMIGKKTVKSAIFRGLLQADVNISVCIPRIWTSKYVCASSFFKCPPPPKEKEKNNSCSLSHYHK
jgi:hypothetical protein